MGDIVFIFLPENFKENNEEKFIELSQERKEKLKEMIVFENDSLFVINKLLGDVVHKGSEHDISLLEEFRSYYSNNNINFVNRIDKLTSSLIRSEEHTSELQSHYDLVCRLLLEKKKQNA